jgi:hypothetical protein
MVKMIGAKAHVAHLRRMTGPEAVQEIGKALYAGGQLIEIEAEISITAGSVSGKGHVASKPGEPPNRDTGVLDGNIETATVEPLKVEVSSNAPYAAELEFGTSKIAERPYMRPATAKKRPEVVHWSARP